MRFYYTIGLILMGFAIGIVPAYGDEPGPTEKCRIAAERAQHELNEFIVPFGHHMPDEFAPEHRHMVKGLDRAAEYCMELLEQVESPAARAQILWQAHLASHSRAVEDGEMQLAHEISLLDSQAVHELTGYYSQEYADTLWKVANAYNQTGDRAAALSALEDELDILQKLHGVDSPKTIPALQHLAVMYQPDIERREHFYAQAIALADNAGAADRDLVAGLARAYSGFKMTRGEYDAAMDVLDRFDIPVE